MMKQFVRPLMATLLAVVLGSGNSARPAFAQERGPESVRRRRRTP